jgi:hypothetical protein
VIARPGVSISPHHAQNLGDFQSFTPPLAVSKISSHTLREFYL